MVAVRTTNLVGASLLGMATLAVHPAWSAPFSGCTFFEPRLEQASWPGGEDQGCASFHIESRSCQKYKQLGPVTVTYMGDIVSGWLPAYFIEVTPYFGRSAFAEDWDGAHLQVQLDLATRWWEDVMSGELDDALEELGMSMEAPEGVSDMLRRGQGEQHYEEGGAELTQTWQARTIEVPYAGLAWNFLSIDVHSGTAFPECFTGISEYTPNTWADLPNNPERPAALIHSPLHGLCQGASSALMGLDITGAGLGYLEFRANPPAECAFRVTKNMARAASLSPTSEAMEVFADPRKACMGRLGPLMPRTGVTALDNPRQAAEQVAFRMASLSGDHWLGGPGIKDGDRWQVVWPRTLLAPTCFQPGEFKLEELVTGGRSYLGLPATDGPYKPRTGIEGESTLVIAVWRRFDRCVEPIQGPLFSVELEVSQPLRKNACHALTSEE